MRSIGVSATPLADECVALVASARARSLTLASNCAGLAIEIHETPSHSLLATYALAGGAEDVGEVVADVALIGQPRETPGPRQDAEQRHLGQADCARSVVNEDDLVAGQSQLVAAAGAGAVDGGQELQAVML